MNNEITNKWEKTGLLDGLDEPNKDKCAALLETAIILLSGELKKYSEEIDKLYDSVDFFIITGLRVVRWLYGDYVLVKLQSLNVRELIEDFYKFCLSKHQLYTEWKTSPCVETDFCDVYIHQFVEAHK